MNDRELKQAREYSVIKRNDLIQKSKYNLSAVEQKIIWFLISKIKFEDKDLKTYTFDINEFCEVCGNTKSNGGNYETVKDAIKTLSDKSFWMPTPDGVIPLIRWIEEPVIIPNSGVIHLKLNEYLKPYLIEIKGLYSTMGFKASLAMKGMYSIRMYELVKSYAGLGQCNFDLDELAEKVGAVKYNKRGKLIEYIYNPYDFKRYVIERSLKEINKFSEINVEYTMGKTGNRYTHVYFNISEKVGAEWYISSSEADKELNKKQKRLT